MRKYILQAKYELKGLKGLGTLLKKKTEVNESIGRKIIYHIHANMRAKGALFKVGWAKLALFTIAKRRLYNLGTESPGDPLMVTKKMYYSWHKRVNASNVTIYNSQKYARFHEYGTKGGLIPKTKTKKGFVAFPWWTHYSFSEKSDRHTEGIAYFKQVKHPGVPPRPMLPPRSITEDISYRTVQEFLKLAGVKMEKKRGGRPRKDAGVGGAATITPDIRMRI